MGQEPVEKLPDKRELHNLAKKYKKELSERSRYDKEGEMLEWLFKTFPNNTDINEVLVKVMSLDSSYSTNLRGLNALLRMALKIISISNFNEKIKNCDLSLVDELCNLTIHNYDEEDIVKGNPFSFASKYCCLQNICLESGCAEKLKQYAIYDSFVAKVLTWYQNNDNFLGVHGRTKLRDKWVKSSYKQKTRNVCKVEALKTSYKSLYYPVVICFRHYYGLTSLSLRDLDHLLWRMGKEYFLSYVMAVVGDYVIVKMIDKTQIAIYRLCEKPNGAANALDACAKENNFVRLPRGETDVDFAFRMLKKYYPCVMRKEGRIGRHHYLQVDESKASVKVYNKKYDSAEEKRKKNNRMSEKELNEIKYSICKAVTDSDTFRGYEVDEKKQLDDVCKDIVEKYREKKRGNIEKSKNKNK